MYDSKAFISMTVPYPDSLNVGVLSRSNLVLIIRRPGRRRLVASRHSAPIRHQSTCEQVPSRMPHPIYLSSALISITLTVHFRRWFAIPRLKQILIDLFQIVATPGHEIFAKGEFLDGNFLAQVEAV